MLHTMYLLPTKMKWIFVVHKHTCHLSCVVFSEKQKMETRKGDNCLLNYLSCWLPFSFAAMWWTTFPSSTSGAGDFIWKQPTKLLQHSSCSHWAVLSVRSILFIYIRLWLWSSGVARRMEQEENTTFTAVRWLEQQTSDLTDKLLCKILNY